MTTRRSLAAIFVLGVLAPGAWAEQPANPLQGRSLPDTFNIADVTLEVRRKLIAPWGWDWLVVLKGDGSGGRYCVSAHRPPSVDAPTCLREGTFPVDRSQLLGVVERLLQLDFNSLHDYDVQSLSLSMDGRGDVDVLNFSTSHGVSTTVSMRVGSYTHAVSFNGGVPCELPGIVDEILAMPDAVAPSRQLPREDGVLDPKPTR